MDFDNRERILEISRKNVYVHEAVYAFHREYFSWEQAMEKLVIVLVTENERLMKDELDRSMNSTVKAMTFCDKCGEFIMRDNP